MIQLGLHTPNPRDSTSIYRAWGPWSALKNEIDITPIGSDDAHWNIMSMIDVLFMHRPFAHYHLRMLDTAIKFNIPIWIDYDDDLFNVHSSNDNHAVYDSPDTQKILENLLNKANLITVSTNALANSLRQRTKNTNIFVIENKLPDHLTGKLLHKIRNQTPSKRILWRGTKHHEMNLKVFEKLFIDLIKERPDWCWTFYGWRPWYLMDHSNPGQTEHMADSDPFAFFQSLHKINASIQVVPLINNAFNQAKSNIAMLEGSGYGESLIVAPEMPEWIAKPGVINFNDADSFMQAMRTAMNMNPQQSFDMRSLSHEWVLNEGVLSKFIKQRFDLIKELIKVENT